MATTLKSLGRAMLMSRQIPRCQLIAKNAHMSSTPSALQQQVKQILKTFKVSLLSPACLPASWQAKLQLRAHPCSVQNLLLPKCHRSYGSSPLPLLAWQSACHRFLRQGHRSPYMGQLQRTATSQRPLQNTSGQAMAFSSMHARQWTPGQKVGTVGGQAMRRLQARPGGDTLSGQTLFKRGVSFLQFPNRHATLLSKILLYLYQGVYWL
jgi:hypothetical protein